MTAKTEKAKPRESIEEVRHNKNNLLIKTVKAWPSMFHFVKEEGGRVPPELSGHYTSQARAQVALDRHLAG